MRKARFPGALRLALQVLTCAATALLLGRSADATEAYKVVVHPGRTLTTITKAQLSDIFLGHIAEWNDGIRIVPVDQIATSHVRDVFSREIHGRRAGAVRSHWLQIMYSGRGVPPIEKGTDDDVIAYVSAHPGAIGYVTSSTPTGIVKVLKVGP